MRIDFGKHKDEIVEYVMLEDPSYIKWVLGQANPSRRLLILKHEVLKLIDIFALNET
jgi:hypothetical protein